MKTLLKYPSTTLSFDQKKKMAVVVFIGDVTFEDYKKTLLAAAELTRSGRIDSIIMDRREVIKLDAECRVWVKNEYLKHHIKPLIPKMRKVAVIQSKSVLGQIYGQTIYKTFALFYPNLSFKSFQGIEEAINWIRPSETRGTMVVEDFISPEEKTIINKSKVSPVQSPKTRGKNINNKRAIIQQNIKSEKMLATVDDQKQVNNLFDKLFNALFRNSN